MDKASVVTKADCVTYEWLNDAITVRLAGAQTGGLCTLTEDHMKPSFEIGLHIHKTHAETFHVLAGEMEFQAAGKTFPAKAGTTLHVPPGVPHRCKVVNGRPAQMLMIYAPAGFEDFLAAMRTLSGENFADAAFMRAFNERFDLFALP